MTREELNGIAEALDNVSSLRGVEVYDGDETAVSCRYFDSYMIAYVLSKMIKEGDCTITVKGNRVDYLRRLISDQWALEANRG